jgi:MoaA/NifB/PqqE/SkfB family radical SAM enzyme
MREISGFNVAERARILADELLFRVLSGRVARLPYPPRYITIGIVGDCTNRCLLFKRIVESARKARVPHIHLCGQGEVLMRRDFWRFADYVIDRYGSVSFQSNLHPALVRRHYDEIIKHQDGISGITTDILSPHPEIHNRIKVGSDLDSVLEIMTRISSDTDQMIVFHLSYIITKQTYRDIDTLLLNLRDRGVNFAISFNLLYTYGALRENEFLCRENVVDRADSEVWDELDRARAVLALEGISVHFPSSATPSGRKVCSRLWKVAQIVFPDREIPEERWWGNAIPQACSAVVTGPFSSMGNLFDHDSLMGFWNNQELVAIRKSFIDGGYPFDECRRCLEEG